jgi:hypothetical protein
MIIDHPPVAGLVYISRCVLDEIIKEERENIGKNEDFFKGGFR